MNLSIHDLTRRSTCVGMNPVRLEPFQFTTSQGGRRKSMCPSSCAQTFQFTTSQGGRRQKGGEASWRNPFQFTTSQGGRLRYRSYWIRMGSFNSRPHKEVDIYGVCIRHPNKAFNSRPHKEVDLREERKGEHYELSIHDLTRRSTSWMT